MKACRVFIHFMVVNKESDELQYDLVGRLLTSQQTHDFRGGAGAKIKNANFFLNILKKNITNSIINKKIVTRADHRGINNLNFYVFNHHNIFHCCLTFLLKIHMSNIRIAYTINFVSYIRQKKKFKISRGAIISKKLIYTSP